MFWISQGARRIVSEWPDLDSEARGFTAKFLGDEVAESSSKVDLESKEESSSEVELESKEESSSEVELESKAELWI